MLSVTQASLLNKSKLTTTGLIRQCLTSLSIHISRIISVMPVFQNFLVELDARTIQNLKKNNQDLLHTNRQATCGHFLARNNIGQSIINCPFILGD